MGESESQDLPLLERQVSESSSSDGMMPMRVFGDPMTGNDSVLRCSSDLVNHDSGEALFFGFMSFGAEVTHGLGNRDFGFTGDMVVSSVMAVIEPLILKEVSLILFWHPWVVQNRFSPLSDLGNGVEAKFGEGEAHEEERSSPHDDTTQQRLVDTVGGFQIDSGLHLLPWEISGVDDIVCGNGEKDNCVLECEPLSRWEPNDLSEVLLVQDSVQGTQVIEFGPPSIWVSQLMKNFCKMVGFPIVKHEAQCLALFPPLE